MIIVDPVAMGDTAFTRPSPKWVYDRTGALVEVPANTLAVTYDPSDLRKAPYALFEPEATSVCQQPEAFDNTAAWTATNLKPVSVADVLSPRGDAAAFKLVEDTTLASRKVRCNAGYTGAQISTNERRTFSVFAKAGERSRIQLQVNGYGGNYANVRFDLINGTHDEVTSFGSAKGFTAGMINVGNGWYRVWITGTPRPDLDSLGCDHDIWMHNLGVSYYAGDGESGLYVFGANVTRGELASYIPPKAIFSHRQSEATVWDQNGVLQTLAVNVPRITYDPTNLARPPYLLVEDYASATNYTRNNAMQGAVVGTPGTSPSTWSFMSSSNGIERSIVGLGQEDGIDYIDVRFSGTVAASFTTYQTIGGGAPAAMGQTWAASAFFRLIGGSTEGATLRYRVSPRDNVFVNLPGSGIITFSPTGGKLSSQRVSAVATFPENPSIANTLVEFIIDFVNGATVDFTIRIGLPQLERDRVTSPIKTSGSVVTRQRDIVTYNHTRAADLIGPAAGLVYSNVPLTEPPYDANATYAKGAVVHDPATKIVYWSMVDANKGNALSDPAKWNKRTPTNRWAMLDDRNDTQTENPEEIVLVLSARAITQGLYLGNLDASEIRVAMTDLRRGLVYREERNLIVSRSKSSFYRWAFTRLRRRTYFLTLKLPVYAHSLVTILIRRPGAVAKCGMCMLGPAIDVGLSHYGLSTELKDFSDTSFNPDGTSKTVVRGYAKRMSVDVEVDNDEIDDVEEELIGFRQKVVVYVGTVLFGSAMLVGKFSSLKKVIPGLRKSRVSLQIEGVVSK